MAKFSFRCDCFKAGQICGLDKHNRRLNENYISNPDINMERSRQNRIYIEPKKTLYQDCKEQIEQRVVARGGRITKASNWICEAVFSYADDLPPERLDEYNALIIKYMNARFNNNVISAVCHLDEGGLPHLHLDILMITEDNRLSAKTLITKDFITSIHRVMPVILQRHGFAVDDYVETEERKKGGLSAKEYKKKMEEEKKALDKKLDEMVEEYNKLVDHYNHLLIEAKALEEKNIREARKLLEERERTR